MLFTWPLGFLCEPDYHVPAEGNGITDEVERPAGGAAALPLPFQSVGQNLEITKRADPTRSFQCRTYLISEIGSKYLFHHEGGDARLHCEILIK